jgi:membrane-associated protease RseP (regulator of RpoE activity)
MDVYPLSVLFFLGILFVLIYRDRKNIEVQYFLLIRKTKIGIKILNKLSKPRIFWKMVGTAGIFIALFLMYDGIVSLVKYSEMLISGMVTAPGLSFVFPSATSQVEAGPGYVLIPFWFWLVMIASVIIPHEAFHGIMSRVENIKVKSTGLLFLLVLPGAFVEPDEKQLKRARLVSKLRVFAAGSLANFLVYIILFNAVSFVIWPYFIPGGIIIQEVNATGPADQAGLKAGMVITEVNGTPVKLTYKEFLGGASFLSSEMEELKPGDEIHVIANSTCFDIKVGSNPENKTLPYLGIVSIPVTRGDANTAGLLFHSLTWMWIINYAICVFNIMPIFPLDGGQFINAIAEKICRKHAKKITYAISLAVLLILLFNFFAPFLLQAVAPSS